MLLLVAVLVARRLAQRYDLGPRNRRAVLETLGWSAIFSSWLYLAAAARRSPIARTLALLLAAAYLWYAISYLAVIAELPLLPDKVTFLIKWLLAVAAALGVVEAGRDADVVSVRVGRR